MPNSLADWVPGRRFTVGRDFITTRSGAALRLGIEYEVLPTIGTLWRFREDRTQNWSCLEVEVLQEILPFATWVADVTAGQRAEWRPGRWFTMSSQNRSNGLFLIPGEMWKVVDDTHVQWEYSNRLNSITNRDSILRSVDWECGWTVGRLFKFKSIPAGIPDGDEAEVGLSYRIISPGVFESVDGEQRWEFPGELFKNVRQAITFIRPAAEEFIAGRKFVMLEDFETTNWEFEQSDEFEILRASATRIVVKFAGDREETISTAIQEQLLTRVNLTPPLPCWEEIGSKFQVTVPDRNYGLVPGITYQVIRIHSRDWVVGFADNRGNSREVTIVPGLFDQASIKWKFNNNRIKFTDLSKDLQNLLKQNPAGKFTRGFVAAELNIAPANDKTPTTEEGWIEWVESTPVKSIAHRFPDAPTRNNPAAELVPEPRAPIVVELPTLTGENHMVRVEVQESVSGYTNWTRRDYYEGEIPVPIEVICGNPDEFIRWVSNNVADHLDSQDGEEQEGDREVTDSSDRLVRHTNVGEVLTALNNEH